MNTEFIINYVFPVLPLILFPSLLFCVSRFFSIMEEWSTNTIKTLSVIWTVTLIAGIIRSNTIGQGILIILSVIWLASFVGSRLPPSDMEDELDFWRVIFWVLNGVALLALFLAVFVATIWYPVFH